MYYYETKELKVLGISKQIGAMVRSYRRARRLSLDQLAKNINKSKSTVAKYETGEINIDIDTLYDICLSLNIPIESLLVPLQKHTEKPTAYFRLPAFFEQRCLYIYYWDGRNNKLSTSLLKIGKALEDDPNTFNAILYMNILNFEQPGVCENTYIGVIEFHHVITAITMTHRDTPLEHIMINILENFSSANTKWGMFSGISFRPFMPVSLKVLISRLPLSPSEELAKSLQINREDIRKMKMYNYFSVTQEW